MPQKLPSGSWRVRWVHLGKWYSKTFPRKFEADQFESQLKLGLIDRTVTVQTFQEFSDKWYEDHCLVKKSPSQWTDDKSILRRHLIPFLGKIKLADLELKHLISLQSHLVREKELKPRTVNNVTGLCRKIIEDAVAWGLLKHNPFRGFEKLPLQEQPFKYWTMAERDRFLNYCKTSDYELFELVGVAANTGLRIGELRGLLCDSLDLAGKSILVQRMYCYKSKKLLQKTKNKRIRRVPMNDFVLKILSSRALAGANQPVFNLSFNTVRKRFNRQIKLSGVRQIRVHDLRHTFASHMAMAGVPIIAIKELLGHSDVLTTMVYAHLCPSYLTAKTDAISPKNLEADFASSEISIATKLPRNLNGRTEVFG
jgi:integrase